MGKRKYLDEIMELFKRSAVVDYYSIRRIIKSKSKNSNYTKLLINNLIKKKIIVRLTKGYYTIHDDPGLMVFCFQPAYIGLQAALSFHGLWEQETIPIILTTSKARVGIRKVNENNVYIRRLEKKHFFGYSSMQDGDSYFPYSDVEKTFIDMKIFKQKINPSVLSKIKKKVNKEKLLKYLKNYSQKTRKEILEKFYPIY